MNAERDVPAKSARQDARPPRRRVVVVGPCASGKTTLAKSLQALGFPATVCGQEHSDIPTLWRRGNPDILVALQVDLETLRRRRGQSWPAAILDRQRRRLADAVAAADLVLDSSMLNLDEVLTAALDTLCAESPTGTDRERFPESESLDSRRGDGEICLSKKRTLESVL